LYPFKKLKKTLAVAPKHFLEIMDAVDGIDLYIGHGSWDVCLIYRYRRSDIMTLETNCFRAVFTAL
jgi:hypothetical protein